MVDKDSKEKDHSRKYSDDDEDQEDEEEDDDVEQKDYSLTLRNKRSATIPKVNLLGADIKLDFLTLAGLAIGSLGALGAGYLIFDQFNKSKVIEEEKKKYLEQERLRQQAITDQYLRAEQIRLQKQQQHNLIESQQKAPAYRMNNEGLVNMDDLGYDEEDNVPQMSYEQMLNRNNNFEPNYRDMVNNSQQRQPKEEEYEEYPQPINMDQLNPVQSQDSFQPRLPPPMIHRKSLPKEHEQQQQQTQNEYNEDRGPTPEELYKTMNENQAYY